MMRSLVVSGVFGLFMISGTLMNVSASETELHCFSAPPKQRDARWEHLLIRSELPLGIWRHYSEGREGWNLQFFFDSLQKHFSLVETRESDLGGGSTRFYELSFCLSLPSGKPLYRFRDMRYADGEKDLFVEYFLSKKNGQRRLYISPVYETVSGIPDSLDVPWVIYDQAKIEIK